MTSMAKSGGPPIFGSPAFYFKQLYNRSEGWTVPRVAAKLGYREEKIEEVLGRTSGIPAGIDTINTKALERHTILPPRLIRSSRFELHYSRAQAISE